MTPTMTLFIFYVTLLNEIVYVNDQRAYCSTCEQMMADDEKAK